MTWTADSGSLIYAAEGDLWRVAAGVSSGQPEKLLADVAMPALSRDGKRLAFARRGPYNVNLWQVGLTAPARPAGPPERLLASSRMHGYAAFSPDGSRVTFTSDRSGSSEIWTSDGDGSNRGGSHDIWRTSDRDRLIGVVAGRTLYRVRFSRGGTPRNLRRPVRRGAAPACRHWCGR